MAFLPLRSVLANIKKRVRHHDGREYIVYDAYLGVDPMTRKPVRMAMASRTELEEAIRGRYRGLKGLRGSETMLTPEQTKDAAQAFLALSDAKLDISLLECARLAIASPILSDRFKPSEQDAGVTVGQAWDTYLESLKTRSPNHQKGVRSRVGRWVMSFGPERKLSEVTAAEVKDDLTKRLFRLDDKSSWTTYNQSLGDVKTFITWCCAVEQKYLKEDPLEGMKKLTVGYRQPKYMKAGDVEKLMRVIERHKSEAPEDLVFAILSFFCGMRTSEIERVCLGDEYVKVRLEDNFIRIEEVKGSSRGVVPRVFDIPKQARAWIDSFDFVGAAQKPNKRFRRHLNKYANEAAIELPKNCGRHTYITMFTAAHHDESALTAIVGNSSDVRAKSYNGVEIEREGKAYFDILPAPASV